MSCRWGETDTQCVWRFGAGRLSGPLLLFPWRRPVRFGSGLGVRCPEVEEDPPSVEMSWCKIGVKSRREAVGDEE